MTPSDKPSSMDQYMDETTYSTVSDGVSFVPSSRARASKTSLFEVTAFREAASYVSDGIEQSLDEIIRACDDSYAGMLDPDQRLLNVQSSCQEIGALFEGAKRNTKRIFCVYTGYISHEVSNSLAIVSGHVYKSLALSKRKERVNYPEVFSEISYRTQNARTFVSAIERIARCDSVLIEGKLPINKRIQETLSRLSQSMRDHQIVTEVNMLTHDRIVVPCYLNVVEPVLDFIVHDCINHCEDGSALSVTTRMNQSCGTVMITFCAKKRRMDQTMTGPDVLQNVIVRWMTELVTSFLGGVINLVSDGSRMVYCLEIPCARPGYNVAVNVRYSLV